MRLRVAGPLFAITCAFASNAFAQQTPPPAPTAPPSTTPPAPPAPPPTTDTPPPLPPPPPGSTEPFRGPRPWNGGPPQPPRWQGQGHWPPGDLPPGHPPIGPDGGLLSPGGPPHMLPPHLQRVPVTVESSRADREPVLERRVKTDEMYGRTLFVVPQHNEVNTWEAVCVAPCKVDLDRSSTYRINGQNKVTQSAEFTLPPAADQVKLEVDPGNLLLHGVAKRVIALGIASGIVGGALLTTAHTWDDRKEERHVRNAGWITSAIGIGLVAIGIPVAILTQTHVKTNDKRVAGRPPPPKLTLDGLVF